MRPGQLITWALVLLWVLPARALPEAAAQPVRIERIDQPMLRAYTPDFSGVVHIQRPGEPSKTLVSGQSDLRTGRAPSAQMAFWIGSLSKQFTAAAVLRLVQQGKLDLEAPLHRVLRGLRPLERAGKSCHLRWLLQHRCGFPRDDQAFRDSLDSPSGAEQLLEQVNAVSLDAAPGERFAYSNLGYHLAGLIVQEVSGMPFERFLRQQLWAPLGMQHTGIAPRPGSEIELARGQLYAFFGYLDALRWLVAPDQLIRRVGPAGGMYSTASDLTRWNRALHTGGVLPTELYAVMTRPGALDKEDPDANYAMGIEAEHKAWGRVFWHNGALEPFGFNSFLGWVPSSGTSLVVLSNRSVHRAHATRLGFKLLGQLHGDTAPPSPPSFSTWRLLSSALPILAVLAIPYVLFLLALEAFRGPKKGALPWTVDFLGNALLLFLLLALFREPRWYAALAGAVLGASCGVCLWRRRLLRSTPAFAAGKSARRSLVNAACGSVVVLGLIWYLLGPGYTLAGGLAAGVVAALVLVPRSGRGHRVAYLEGARGTAPPAPRN